MGSLVAHKKRHPAPQIPAPRSPQLAFILAVGSQVNATAVAYEIPFSVSDSTTAKKLAALLEVKLIPLFSDVVASTDGPIKVAAQIAKTKATARAAAWAGTPMSTPAPNASSSH